MQLDTYLQEQKISKSDFADLIGVSQAAVSRYTSGNESKKRLPEPSVMRKIFEVTSGAVQPNDFYSVNAA